MKLLVLIPAKLDSKRLVNKNIQKINSKTLVEHSIDYAKQSQYNPEIILSSESEIIREMASSNNVSFILREKNLCGDAEVVDVLEGLA